MSQFRSDAPVSVSTQWIGCGRRAAWSMLAWAVWTTVWAAWGTVPARAQSAAEAAPALDLADQRLADARLIDITDQGRFSFLVGAPAGADIRQIARDEIVRWGRKRRTGDSALVWLGDGSWLAGQVTWKSEHALELVSDWFAPVELQTGQIRGLVLHPSPSLKRFHELEREMLAVTGSADVLWNSRSEQLSGILSLSLRPALESELPPNPVWRLKTAASTDPIEFAGDAVQAMVLSPILRRPVPTNARPVRLDLRDGSQLNVIAVERTSDDRVKLTLADNRTLEALDSSTQFASAIARITGQPERIVWLGELEPARYRFAEQPGGMSWPLGRNEDLFGNSLFADSAFVPHGITMHAPSQVAYRWDGRAAKFLAEVSLYGSPAGGIPGGLSTPLGSVECKVLIARESKLVEIFRSQVLRGGGPAVPVEVDVTGAQLVVLLVEQADQGSIGDHALWRDARLVPSTESQPSAE